MSASICRAFYLSGGLAVNFHHFSCYTSQEALRHCLAAKCSLVGAKLNLEKEILPLRISKSAALNLRSKVETITESLLNWPPLFRNCVLHCLCHCHCQPPSMRKEAGWWKRGRRGKNSIISPANFRISDVKKSCRAYLSSSTQRLSALLGGACFSPVSDLRTLIYK